MRIARTDTANVWFWPIATCYEGLLPANSGRRDTVKAIGLRHRCSFLLWKAAGLSVIHVAILPEHFLNNVAFSAITSKLDKDLQDDKDGYATCRHDRKRDRVCRLITSYTVL